MSSRFLGLLCGDNLLFPTIPVRLPGKQHSTVFVVSYPSPFFSIGFQRNENFAGFQAGPPRIFSVGTETFFCIIVLSSPRNLFLSRFDKITDSSWQLFIVKKSEKSVEIDNLFHFNILLFRTNVVELRSGEVSVVVFIHLNPYQPFSSYKISPLHTLFEP